MSLRAARWLSALLLVVATVAAPAALLGQPVGPEGTVPAGQGLHSLAVEASGARPVVFRFAPADSGIVSLLAERAGRFVPAPVAALDLPPDTIEVVVAPDERAFREATGGRAPDWGLAVAFPALRRVVMRSPRITGEIEVDPAVVLRHELGHVYLGAALDDGGERLPRWFNEGFAALYADEWRWVGPYRLAWARLTGTLTPLARLHDDFPEADPSLAYIQSMAAVRGLERRGGDEGLGFLLARMQGGATFDASLRETYGITLDQFYAQWETELGRQYGWTVALADQQGLWIGLAVLVLLLFAVRRRAIRRKIEEGIRAEDEALGRPGDHSLGVEEWERYWEWEDDDSTGDEWKEEDRDER